jgi:hypothetical protein
MTCILTARRVSSPDGHMPVCQGVVAARSSEARSDERTMVMYQEDKPFADLQEELAR